MTSRHVHPAALMAVGVVLGWAIAQPFPVPASAHHAQHQHRPGPCSNSPGPVRDQTTADGIDRTAETNRRQNH